MTDRPITIAIDARWIFPEISGVGAYTRALIHEFSCIDAFNRYELIFDNAAVAGRTAAETGYDEASNFRRRLVPFGPFSVRNQLLLPSLLRRWNCDVYHSSNYMIPLAHRRAPSKSGTRYVVSIHDVIPLVLPDHAPKSRKTRLLPLYRYVMRRVGRAADALLTVSECSRRDLIEHLNIPAADTGKVHVVHNGVGTRFRPADDAAAAPLDAGTPRPRELLYVGRADPYKNVCMLIRVLARLRRQRGDAVRLTIVGPRDERYPEAGRLSQELGVADAVRWTGYLPQNQLIDAYRKADVLVHPSHYEGFGLQVIEAMACGLPVVCSTGGSLPEVAGDAALTVDPDDAEGFANAAARVLDDAAFAADLAAKGRTHAAQFTWRRAAEKTLDVYRNMLL